MTTKIMVVEDQSIVALNLQRRLIRLGYAVPWVAASHDQALQGVAQTNPHLVLMDIHISGAIDGIDTAAEMSVPVIYLTAYSEEKVLERAKATKPYGYLLKPFSERELHATIQMALRRQEVELALIDSEQQVLQRVAERLRWEKDECMRQFGALRAAKRLAERDAERFLAVIESHVDAHLILHSVRDVAGRIADFRFEYINEVAEVVLRIERQATVGHLLSDQRSNSRIGGHFDAYVKVVEAGKELAEEFRVNDTQDWMYHEVVKFGDGISIRSRDITDRKCIQQSLRQKDELLKKMADLSADYRTRSF